jgi:formate-dependent nitrite reductase membrane component NrfD
MFLASAEHFVRAPEWTWYILFYFFFAGLAGGAYVLATLLRLAGGPRDEPAARLGFYISLPATLICPILLTADLGASWSRFWHMLVDVTPGDTGLNFKYGSPMSVGVWALLVFGFFVAVSALDTWARDRRGRPAGILGESIGRVFNIVGAIFGLFIASYTGVLLSVSNQPVWSDTWALGGLFLASGLSGAAAAITLLVRYRPDAAASLERLRVADAYFSILELVLLVAFFVTVAVAGTAGRIVPWLPLWIIALIGIGASMIGIRQPTRVQASGGSAAMAPVAVEATVVSILVLIAVLAMRAAVIFSAQ